jgi:hypothetical protein
MDGRKARPKRCLLLRGSAILFPGESGPLKLDYCETLGSFGPCCEWVQRSVSWEVEVTAYIAHTLLLWRENVK